MKYFYNLKNLEFQIQSYLKMLRTHILKVLKKIQKRVQPRLDISASRHKYSKA